MDEQSSVQIATLELLVKTLKLTIVKSNPDPNIPHYIWNTFENSLDSHTVQGADEIESKEKIRVHGQELMQSVLRGAGFL